MMRKIKFLSDQVVMGQGEIVKAFNAGEVYELSAASANRWIRRNLATEVQGSIKPVPAKSKPEAMVKPKRKYTRKPPITSTATEDNREPITSTPEPSE